MQKLLTILFWAIFFHNSSIGQKIDSKTQLEQIDKFLSSKYNNNTPGCVIGIVKDGKLVFNKGFGMANLDYRIPMTSKSTINIMSVSKQFTAACIALLIIDKRLSLIDDVHKYIPELREYGQTITIEHLVRHTSGIRDYNDLVTIAGGSAENIATRSDGLALVLRQKELNFVPGSQYSYSNSGYLLLSYIVERVSGMSFEAFTKKRIFEPLGMNESFFSDDPHQIIKNRVVSYGKDEQGKYFSYNLNDNRMGCGGLFTTVEDLYKWDQNFYNGKVGGEVFNALMLSQKPLNDGKENDYAFGNIIDRHEGFKEILHSGGLLGIRCKLSRFPSEKLSIIYLGNGSQDVNEEFYPIASLLLINKPLPVVSENRPITSGKSSEIINDKRLKSVAENKLTAYTGNYYCEDLQKNLEIKREEDNLVFQIGGTTSRQPLPVKSNQVQFNHPLLGLVTIVFNRKNHLLLSTERTSNLTFIKL